MAIRDRLIWLFWGWYRSIGHSWADTNISAIHGPITDISKFFKFCLLLHYQKYNVFYILPFFQKLLMS